jgi:hypothetical protein
MAFRQGDPGYFEDRDAIVAAIMAQLGYGSGGSPNPGFAGDSYFGPSPYNLLGGNGAPGTPSSGNIHGTAVNANPGVGLFTSGDIIGPGRGGFMGGPFNAFEGAPITTSTFADRTSDFFGPAPTPAPAPAPTPTTTVTVATPTPTPSPDVAVTGPGPGPTGAPGMGDVSAGYTTGYGSDQVGYGGDIAGGPGVGFGTGTGPGFGGFGDPGGYSMSGLEGSGFSGFDSGPASGTPGGFDAGGSGEGGGGGGGGGK